MLASILGILIAGAILLIIIFLLIGTSISNSTKKEDLVEVEKNSILYINSSTPIVEKQDVNPFAAFNGAANQVSLYQIIQSVKYAKTDDNIKGIYINTATLPCGTAQAEELRNALLDFKQSKKFIYSYAESFTQGGYYLASVADSIYVNPQGTTMLKGLSANLMFYKDALDKLGVDVQVIRHGKFKSAVEPYLYNTMSPENRKQVTTYMNSIWQELLTSIATSRHIQKDTLNAYINRAAVTDATTALQYGLVDGIKYEDEVMTILQNKTQAKTYKDLNLVKAAKYASIVENKAPESDNKIAIIYADGEIADGAGDEGVRSETMVKLLRKARIDEDVKAIVLRINSPGGSALASDVMWRELYLIKQAKKPLVVSMANVAASGGYYIAAPADKIFANHTTITGSIGVFGMIPNTQKLLNEKIGVHFDTVKTNKYADIMSINRPMTEDEKAIIQKDIEKIYTTFITKVGQGRNIPTNEVDSVGQGRVWSGTDAKNIRLIDEFGGIDAAVLEAAKLSKLKLGEYQVWELPENQEPIEKLIKKLNQEEDEKAYIKQYYPALYQHYKALKSAIQTKGIQTRMEFDVVIE